MIEKTSYEITFGAEGVAKLSCEIAEKVRLRITYAGADIEATFPNKEEALEFMEAFEKGYAKRYPPLSQVSMLAEKFGAVKKKVPARVKAA